MFGRKTGFLAAMAMALMMFGGCGTNGTLTESQKKEVTDWYNNRVTNGTTNGGNAYWDGYGVNSGNGTTDRNNAERNTYGMRTDGTTTDTGTTLGQDVRNAWDNVKNDVKNMGNGNAGGNNNGK
ncbi:MAG: hypothetical protein IJY52_07805 [Anaerotignum sp.]|nr:hypothetical protein [Anaerotignum sp.]